jgi:diguanylate cyclase (GGDEF)-like protein
MALLSRPPVAWSLALLFAFKGAIALAAVAFPVSSGQPTQLLGKAGVAALVGAVVVWLVGERLPLWMFELMAAVGAVETSALVARSTTHGGMMIAAFAYPWIAIYAAHFFSRRVVMLQATLISVGFGAGLLVGGLPHIAIYWVIVTATTWSICLVLGHLSEGMRRQAGTDPLTGLLNRNGFRAAAEREHAIARRTGNPLTLAVIDLNGFKQINDAHGHGAGDRLLADVARSWSERLRAGDILARHGGDEFVLLLPATSLREAGASIERLDDERLPVDWSVGVGEWLPHETLADCLARADSGLYSAKNAIRADRIASAEPALESAGAARATRSRRPRESIQAAARVDPGPP